jgi:transposase-like protein
VAAWTPTRIPTRRKFKCTGCYHQFSVTSGTIFASRKMSFTDLLAAITIFANAVKGISALQLSRDLDCQHKTAFVLAHKIREAMVAETKGLKLTGEVEIDGAYFGGHIRPANKVENRIASPRTVPDRQASCRFRHKAARGPYTNFHHSQRG